MLYSHKLRPFEEAENFSDSQLLLISPILGGTRGVEPSRNKKSAVNDIFYQ
jgi:hypothetical protein